jgi:hypothetical protein
MAASPVTPPPTSERLKGGGRGGGGREREKEGGSQGESGWSTPMSDTGHNIHWPVQVVRHSLSAAVPAWMNVDPGCA